MTATLLPPLDPCWLNTIFVPSGDHLPCALSPSPVNSVDPDPSTFTLKMSWPLPVDPLVVCIVTSTLPFVPGNAAVAGFALTTTRPTSTARTATTTAVDIVTRSPEPRTPASLEVPIGS